MIRACIIDRTRRPRKTRHSSAVANFPSAADSTAIGGVCAIEAPEPSDERRGLYRLAFVRSEGGEVHVRDVEGLDECFVSLSVE